MSRWRVCLGLPKRDDCPRIRHPCDSTPPDRLGWFSGICDRCGLSSDPIATVGRASPTASRLAASAGRRGRAPVGTQVIRASPTAAPPRSGSRSRSAPRRRERPVPAGRARASAPCRGSARRTEATQEQQRAADQDRQKVAGAFCDLPFPPFHLAFLVRRPWATGGFARVATSNPGA